ncbi:MAG TPA: hypothetical protein VFY68_18455 [Nitrososphaeraceae archaeon]|nr:hypothetical protein [Nitrososphaeraceae archaeon]
MPSSHGSGVGRKPSNSPNSLESPAIIRVLSVVALAVELVYIEMLISDADNIATTSIKN